MSHGFKYLPVITFYEAIDLRFISCLVRLFSIDSSIKIRFLLFIEQILYLALFVNQQLEHSEQERASELLMGCRRI